MELGDQEDLLAGFRAAGEEAADAFLAQAVAVGLGRVPVGNAPFQSLLEEQLVVDGVERPPRQRMDTSTPVLPSLRLGTVWAFTAPAAGWLCGGEGPGHAAPGHSQAGESDGGHKLPACQVSIFSFPAHGKFLLRAHGAVSLRPSLPPHVPGGLFYE